MKKSASIDLMKSTVGVRLTYLINGLVKDFNNKQLSSALGISTSSLYKIKNAMYDKISLGMLLSVVEHLGVKYTMSLEFTGKNRKINVTGIESAVGIQYKGILRGERVVLQRIQ